MKLACLLCLTLILAIFAPLSARADCRYLSGGNTSVTFSGLPTTITVPANAAIGQVLATSGQAAPINPPTIGCGSYFFGVWLQGAERMTYGVSNTRGGYQSDNITYDTGIAGVGYRIKHPDDYLTPYPLNSQSGSVLTAGKLGDWRWDSLVPETFYLGNSITFTTPSCDLATDPINVTLPPVSTGAFSGVGSTTGNTPFQISLNCPPGVAVTKITMHTASPDSHPGVVQPSGPGYAAGIGVRVLDSSMNPVVFETQMAINPGATSSIPYYAQYFQTAPAVSAGNVKATVTFDIFYQ